MAEMQQLMQQMAEMGKMFHQTMQAFQQMVQTSAHGGTQTRASGNNLHKFYARLDKFAGDEGTWKEWWYQFGVATNAYDEKAAALMETIEKM